MFSSMLSVVLCVVFLKVTCASASCGDYPDETTCNFKGTQSCKYTGTSCAYANCGHFNESKAVCEANNGQLKCKYSDADKCHNGKCADYADSQTSCEANDGTLSCKFTAGTPNVCGSKFCFTWNPAVSSSPTAEENATCAASDGKLKCMMRKGSGNYWSCDEKECGDYNASKEDCDSFTDNIGSCRFSAGAAAGEPNTCVRAYCNGYTDSASCAANNGHLDCFWSESRKCYSVLVPCLEVYSGSKSECEGAPSKYNCVWSSFWDACGPLGCSSFDKTSQAACENSHPECHFSGDKCEEGSGASTMSVPTLIMLLLLFAAIFVL